MGQFTAPPSIVTLNSFSCVALLFHVCEWLSALIFEITYIWSKPSSSMIKWQYLSSRYLGLGIQVANVVIRIKLHPDRSPSLTLCRNWYTIQTVVTAILISLLNLSLAHRIFGMYHTFPYTKAIFAAVALEGVSNVTFGVPLTQAIQVQKACVIEKIAPACPYSMIAPITLQVVIWTLIVAKSTGIGGQVSKLVLRDGSLAFGLMLALLTAILTSIIAGLDLANLTFIIAISIATSVNCHMIMNMEGMREAATEFELSTFFTPL